MSQFLIRHRVVLGGLAIGFIAGLCTILSSPGPTPHAGYLGYVVGAMAASLIIYGPLGGFAIWLVTRMWKSNAKGS
jgi:hypothetical protein